MKLQHNGSGESSEDLISLIIAVRRKGGRERCDKLQPGHAGVNQVCLFTLNLLFCMGISTHGPIFTHALFSNTKCLCVHMKILRLRK